MKRYRREAREKIIQHYHESGLSTLQYSRQHDLSEASPEYVKIDYTFFDRNYAVFLSLGFCSARTFFPGFKTTVSQGFQERPLREPHLRGFFSLAF